MLYVLDEPTIGLHPRDNKRLLSALKRLRDLGNTLVLVEHDREVIEAADNVVDFGPGSGDFGGEVTAFGTPKKVRASAASLTGRYLSGKLAIPVPTNRRAPSDRKITIKGARHHNLRDMDASFPVGLVTAVTGVSGSGKSSLVEDILVKAAAKKLHRATASPGSHERIDGLEHVDKIISVDQTPIGGTPASNPATYSGLFDLIRELFAKMPEAKVRGYAPGRFSFNLAGGRCEACEGAGQKRIEMHFLPDVWVPCESCGGSRYTSETLAVKFRGKSIADVLDMTVDAALELFAGVPKIRRVLQTLHDVGLGYVRLGQAGPTLSGGEAQRVKLAAELARPDTGRTLYVLDEPTTGLHLDDVKKLLAVIHRLADLGNTVVIIEHNLEVIKTADWMLDIGPEAGADGGRIVAEGLPESVAKACEGEPDGRCILREGALAASPREVRPTYDPKAAARKIIDEARKADLANESKPPWKIDGRTWHTRDRVTRTGKPVRWDGAIVASVVDQVEALGLFEPTDWSERAVVRVAGGGTGNAPFLEILTGHEWIVTLRFFVATRRYKAPGLAARLGLTPFHEAEKPVLSDAPRVSASLARNLTILEITAHSAEDLATDAFAEFVREAARHHREPGDSGFELVTTETLVARTAGLGGKSRRA